MNDGEAKTGPFLPVFFLAVYAPEPLVSVLAIVNTVKASRGPASGTGLFVCWAAFAVHSIALPWLVARPNMQR